MIGKEVGKEKALQNLSYQNLGIKTWRREHYPIRHEKN